jgi:hypothetical protein
MQLKVARNGDRLVLGTVSASTIHEIIGTPPQLPRPHMLQFPFFSALAVSCVVCDLSSALPGNAARELRPTLPAPVDRKAGAQGSRRLRDRPLRLLSGHFFEEVRQSRFIGPQKKRIINTARIENKIKFRSKRIKVEERQKINQNIFLKINQHRNKEIRNEADAGGGHVRWLQAVNKRGPTAAVRPPFLSGLRLLRLSLHRTGWSLLR